MSINENLFFYFNNFALINAWFDKLIIFFAEYLGYLLVALFFGLLFLKRDWETKKMEIFILTTLLIVLSRGFFTEIIRFFYHHPRPFVDHSVNQLIFNQTSFSFPSGHAAFYFALAFVVWVYDRRWGTIFIIGALLMGIARVASGVHYPFDILGG